MQLSRKLTPNALRFYHRPMLASFDDFWGPFNNVPDFTHPNLTLHRTPQNYHVTEDDKEFKLAFDVPGVKADNIKIELKDDGRVLHLSGGRTVQTENEFSEIKFSKSFTLGSNIDSSHLTASLADGVLTVSAPKKKEVVQKISITVGDSAADKEMIDVARPEEKKE